MKFDHFDAIFYYVSDLERSISFYRGVLGFQFESRDTVARFRIGDVPLELVPTSDAGQLSGRGNARLCLEVSDMGAAIAELRAAGVKVEEQQPKENGTLSVFHDPDGNEICLWQYAPAPLPR